MGNKIGELLLVVELRKPLETIFIFINPTVQAVG